ncbi:hypothetical protein LshimejAT787_1602270 [Lyophyllum shimeji]|uniref:Uncharacterized protein n=1 Tax=Lyophyllum shimeji TaxID=47721 RepID=A0A9P3PZW1_LYOSH|nr:hypothetical protein LshimejAT787_1602270 [Lyophyllum shimeji]
MEGCFSVRLMAQIEIAEEVGESNVFFFGHLTPAVEDLRYQHMYHPIPSSRNALLSPMSSTRSPLVSSAMVKSTSHFSIPFGRATIPALRRLRFLYRGLENGRRGIQRQGGVDQEVNSHHCQDGQIQL